MYFIKTQMGNHLYEYLYNGGSHYFKSIISNTLKINYNNNLQTTQGNNSQHGVLKRQKKKKKKENIGVHFIWLNLFSSTRSCMPNLSTRNSTYLFFLIHTVNVLLSIKNDVILSGRFILN